MLRLTCWIFLVLSTLAKPSTSGLVSHKITKRAVCPSGGGDQVDWCNQFKDHCKEGMLYYAWMTQNCPATCGHCQVCPSGRGDQVDWCSQFKDHCNEGMLYYAWMMVNCPATCGQCEVCPPGGGDQVTWCSEYEDHCKEGMLYHAWMMQNCRTTCGQCKDAPTTAPPPSVEQVVAVASVDCLSAHNEKRKLHINTPAIVWDDNLAQDSESWSLKLARDHSDPVNLVHGSYGENLAYFGSTGDVGKTCKDAVESWYNEINDYDWNNPGNPVEVGKAIGHFTQVVWKSSTKVGCGAAKIKRGIWNRLFITCRYLPHGNVIGAYSSNVLALA